MGDLEELAGRARNGDREAFSELVARTYTDTYTLAYRITGSDADACDVVQDAYVRAFRSIESFRGDARFSTWLFRITANCASTHMSRTRRNRHEHLDDEHVVVDTRTAHDPQLHVDNGVLHRRLVAALERLPKAMREVVVLRDVYDLTHEHIAKELDITVTAAKVRLHRARKKLRELLGADLGVTTVREVARRLAAGNPGEVVRVSGPGPSDENEAVDEPDAPAAGGASRAM